MASADLVIGCDPIVAAHKETMLRMQPGKTHVALNAHSAPTAAFVHNGSWQNPGSACQAEITKAVGAERVGTFDADTAATRLMGDSIYANPMLLGYAWQQGWVPLGLESIMRAIELNAVAVDNNKAAFTWGRRAACNLASVQNLYAPAQVVSMPAPRQGLDALVAQRIEFLTAYQNAAYAARYAALVARVQAAEERLPEAVRGKNLLSQAVARGLFKLMSYKDEYEVARLHTQTGFEQQVQAMFEGDFKINYHLAPPLLSRRNDKGELQKSQFGPWMASAFRLLTRLKGLRGTALDVFGFTEERRSERALIDSYRASIEEVITSLNAANHAAAVELARIPEQIKGYGHVKERHLLAARQNWAALTQAFRSAS
jgi:indolepyruvate ferredoxin oxidoreductase